MAEGLQQWDSVLNFPATESHQNTWRLGIGGKVLNNQSHELPIPESSAGSRLTNVANEAPQTPSEGESYRVYLQGKGRAWEWGGAQAQWLQTRSTVTRIPPTEGPKAWFTLSCSCLGDKRALQRGGEWGAAAWAASQHTVGCLPLIFLPGTRKVVRCAGQVVFSRHQAYSNESFQGWSPNLTAWWGADNYWSHQELNNALRPQQEHPSA